MDGLWTLLQNNRVLLIDWRRKTVVRLLPQETLFLFRILLIITMVTFYQGDHDKFVRVICLQVWDVLRSNL